MLWNIVTDSSCDLRTLDKKNDDVALRYKTVPFVISAGGKDYIDDDDVNLEEMLDTMERSRSASHTACPAPSAWMDEFEREGDTVAVTISKNLSGSYNSACAAVTMTQEEHPGKRLAVVNSRSAGAGLVLIVRRLCTAILSGMDFDRAVAQAKKTAESCRTVFALCSFENLVKNGRMNRFTGFVAQKLGFWGIGVADPEGRIAMKTKARGAKKALEVILDDMRERGVPTQYVIISHCQNREMAEKLRDAVLERWSTVKVEIHATRALCSYYAERHGLIVAYI